MKAKKKLKSAIKKIAVLVLGICLFAGCNMIPEDDGTAPPPLFPQPKSVEANPEGGHAVNPVTGDTIQPLINSLGDTLRTGIPVPARGKIIHHDSVAQSKVIKTSTEHFVEVNAHPNRHKISENIPTFQIDQSQLNTVKIGEGNQDFVLTNSTGDTIPTGIPIPVKGKVVIAKQPTPKKALPPAFKDAAIANIQYLDVDQGMPSSYVLCALEDKSGNLWFGTWGGGVTKYNGSSFTHYTEREGLSNNIVWSILEDKSGNLWFGTNGGGVTKYNGSSFTHYTEQEGLSNNRVRSILEDKSGNLWFGTNGGGVTKYNGNSFTHYTAKEGLSNNRVRSILEDKSGNLWFGTNGGGVMKYNGSSFIHYTEQEGLSNNLVRSILEDKSGNLWFGTNGGGVTKYNGSSFTHYTEQEGLNSNLVRSIHEDKSGNLWFGTEGGGVTKYNGSSFTHYTEQEGLSSNLVRSILEDKSANLWFVTWGGGVTKYNGSSFTHYTEQEGLSNTRVRSILEDISGDLWFGTWGGGVTKYNGSSFIHYTAKQGLSNNIVLSIHEDKNGNLWFGTWGGGVTKYNGSSFTQYTEQEGLSNNSVLSIHEDKSGNLWFGTEGGGVTKYNGSSFTHYTEQEGLSNNRVRSIHEDKSGNLWFGTNGGGVTKYNGSSFTYYTEQEGLSNNSVLSIHEDKSGNLWFGTEGGGVTKYNGSSFTYYIKQEGLSNNKVWSILEDKSGNLWFGTEKGLNYFSILPSTLKVGGVNSEQFKINSLVKGDGLKGLDFILNSAFIDSKNNAWWGGGKGLATLDLNAFKTAHKPPVIYLKQLDINEQFIDYRNITDSLGNEIEFKGVQRFENYPLNLELPYDKNHLTFHFVGIDWAAPHKVKYSYRLLGLDERWSNPTNEAKTDYRNLSFGTYTFQVRTIGESQEWSEPIEYTFTIRPPWWHTWWAYGIYLLMFLSALRVYSLWRERNLRHEKEKLQQKVEERTQDLKKKSEQLEHSLVNLKSTQDQLIQQEKLASLGQLTAGIAHEIKNPLNFVNNFSDVSIEMIDEAIDEVKAQDLAPQPQDDILEILSDIKSNLGKIHEHGSRADGIVKSMLQHSRGGTGKMEPTDLNTLIREYVNLSFHGMRAGKDPINVDIQLDLDESIDKVDLVGEDFSRVILNLCGNAFDAMRTANPQGLGSLHVRTKKHKDTIIIEVEDNGPGIPDEIKDKILQPFFTTKRGTDGTGLGLSITNDIVKAHGGVMEIESKVGEGTKFKIILH